MDTGKKTAIKAFLGYNDIAKMGYFFLRIFLGISFIYHGMDKLSDGMFLFGNTLNSLGIPFPEMMGYTIAYLEIIAGASIVLGLFTRVSALIVMTIVYSAIFIAHFNDPFTIKELPALFFFVSLLYFLGGAGDHSLDAILLDKMHLEHKSNLRV